MRKTKIRRELRYDIERAAKEFNAIVKALNATQPLVMASDDFETVTVRVPKFYKDELRVDKARYGIPMGTQLRAFAMKERRKR